MNRHDKNLDLAHLAQNRSSKMTTYKAQYYKVKSHYQLKGKIKSDLMRQELLYLVKLGLKWQGLDHK
jgi:hypothetical protein